MNSKDPVTPSEQVDHVWHIHLSQLSQYDSDIKMIMPKGKFEHNPTAGGKQEGDKYLQQYTSTLQLYQQFFGEPPSNIWEPIGLRFNPVWFSFFHIDLHRFANYMGSVELVDNEINPVEEIMLGQESK